MIYKILITLLFSLNVFAQTNLDDIKSFKAKFSQSILNDSNKEIKYEGNVFISKYGKVLWQYQTPIIKNVYLVNNTVIVDEPELEQAIYTTLENGMDFAKLLKTAKNIGVNQYKSTIEGVDYTIHLNEKKIDTLSYKDNLGNKIFIKFENVEQNIDINDEIFVFLPPKDYDIIRK